MFNVLALLAALAMSAIVPTAHAAPIGKTPFEKVIYINAAVSSTNSPLYSGVDYTNAKGWYDGDLWAIPAGTVIEQMYMISDVALAGVTLVEIGDDDDANDFIASSSSPLASTGIYYWSIQYKGDYLKNLNSLLGPNAKYYAAAGKEVKLNVTGTATTGKARLVIRGYHLD